MKIEDKYINLLLTRELDRLLKNTQQIEYDVEMCKNNLKEKLFDKKNSEKLIKKIKKHLSEEIRIAEGECIPYDFLCGGDDEEDFDESI